MIGLAARVGGAARQRARQLIVSSSATTRSDAGGLGLTLAGLVAACLLVHRAMLTREAGFFVNLIRWDLTDFMWPKLAYLSDCLRAGIWPVWNPYDFAGAPVFSNAATLYHHPLAVLYAATIGFSLQSLQVYLLLLYVLGAGAMYALARHHAAPRPLAVLFGTLYVSSGFALGNAQHLPQMTLFLTEPLTLLLLLRLAEDPGRRSFVAAVAGVCLLVSGGYPSILGHLSVFNVIMTGLPCLLRREWRALAALLGAHATALFVMLPMLLPAALSLAHITRGAGVSYPDYIRHSLPPANFVSALNPFLGLVKQVGEPINISLRNCALGLPVATLLLYAAARPARNRLLLAYVAVAAAGCLGGRLPTGRLFHAIPILGNSLHVTYEFRVLLIFAAFLLAVRTAPAFLAARTSRLVAACTLAPPLLAAALLLPVASRLNIDHISGSLESFLSLRLPDPSVWILVLVLPLVFAMVYASCLRRPQLSLAALAATGVAEAALSSGFSYATVVGRVHPRDRDACLRIERTRPVDFPIPAPFVRTRVYPDPNSMGSVLKAHSDWGYDSTVLRSTESLLKSPRGRLLYGPYLRFLPAGCENESALRDAGHRITAYGPNGAQITFDPPARPVTAVLNFAYYPGWRASSAGRRRACGPVLGGLTGVRLEPGDSQLSLVFRPGYYYALAGCSAAVLAALLAAAWPRPVTARARWPGRSADGRPARDDA